MNYPAASSGVSKTPTLKADFAASGGELTPKEINLISVRSKRDPSFTREVSEVLIEIGVNDPAQRQVMKIVIKH